MHWVIKLFCCLTFIKRCLPLLVSFPFGEKSLFWDSSLEIKKLSCLKSTREKSGGIAFYFINTRILSSLNNGLAQNT